MDHPDGKIICNNNVLWYNGSSANILANAIIEVHGSWAFQAGANVSMNNGSVNMTGAGNNYIDSDEDNCYFYNLIIDKDIGASVSFHDISTEGLHIHGDLLNAGESTFDFASSESIYLEGNLWNLGTIAGNADGTFVFNGTDQLLYTDLNTADTQIGNLIIDSSIGTTLLGNGISMLGNLEINNGTLNSNGCNIQIAGDWTNNVGDAGFTEGTGRVVFNSDDHQYCYGETFNILELNRPMMDFIIPNSTTTTCQQLDWTDYNGELEVDGGTFIAYDLEESGIFGNYYVTSNGGLLELHQDSGQFVDLNGQIVLSGGTMNVYGGSGTSWWPYSANATITMYNGVLDFKDVGIFLSASNTLTETITGGTIRTAGSFTGFRTDYNPTGGTIELYGTTDASLSMGTGSNLYNVLINKAATDNAVAKMLKPSKNERTTIVDRDGTLVELTRSNTVFAEGDLDINGNFIIDSGTFDLNGNTVAANDVSVNNGGSLIVDEGAILQLYDSAELAVNSGGILEVVGTSGNLATVTHRNSDYYYFNVYSGGTISAQYGLFEYMTTNGVFVRTGGIVDPANSFDYCTFQNGAAGVAVLLLIDNYDDITITGANFPDNASCYYNVGKTVNPPSTPGTITMEGYTGIFSGEVYDFDYYNRIDWALPEINNLTIQYNSVSDEIELTWTYPIPVDHFKVYRSTDPNDFSGATIFTTPTVGYSEPATGTKYFYQVTADYITERISGKP